MKLTRKQLRRLIMEDLGPDRMEPFDDGSAVKKIKTANKAVKPKLKIQKKAKASDQELVELQNKFDSLVDFLFEKPGGQFDLLLDMIADKVFSIERRLDILEKRTEFSGSKTFDNFKGISDEDSAMLQQKAKAKKATSKK